MADELVIDLDGTAPAEKRGGPFYFRPLGAALALFDCRAPEVLLDGPKDTGKTRACVTYGLMLAGLYPGSRGLICRKSRRSITQSVQVTFEKKVLPPGHPIRFHGLRQEYQLPNGSVIVLGGLSDQDGTTRVQSSEYDWIYVPEATELSENELEMLTGLLRNGVMPWQQLVMDCNPGAPSHWLNQRCNRGQTKRLISRHQDNPSITPGRLARLAALTGVRRKRLFEGVWAAAEGMVYDGWDPAVHIVDRFDVPSSWRRLWLVDFGYSHSPFAWWAVAESPDGDLYGYHEIYMTRRLVEDHARTMISVTRIDQPDGEPKPEAIICDHDAEGRATLERHLGLRTKPAFKAVAPGIQAMVARLKFGRDEATGAPLPGREGRPRLYLMRDSLVERDQALADPDEGPPRPASTAEEFEAYIWNPAKDQPVKEDDHGLDAWRYGVAYVDRIDQAFPGHGVEHRRGDDTTRGKRRPETAGIRNTNW